MTEQQIDPITLEVIRNALPAISNEMALDLQRTSYNMMIYEVQDFCTALISPQGQLLSQNIGGVAHFVADLGVVIRAGVDRYGIEGFAPGDVILHNHQATAGQHLNNVVVYTPAFLGEELVAFAVVRAHWIDVGGQSTGFGAMNAFDPWSEGLQFDSIKVIEAGEPNDTLLRFIRDNIRFPDECMGDLRSQTAACHLGERRYVELLTKYGADLVLQAIQTIYAESESRCRAVVAKMPDGIYSATATLDPDATGHGYKIAVSVTISGEEMEIDLSGCSSQREGGINSRTYAGAFIAYKALTGPDEPLNEGSFAALKVVLPEGNMMMARYPATMARWSDALPTVVDTILRALADALPERIPAAHSGSLGGAIAFSGFDVSTGRSFVAMSIEAGGWGGRSGRDGPSAAMSVCQGDVRNSPIESLELKAPLLVLERRFRPDSGGPGKFRGGLGLEVHARALAPGQWDASSPSGGRVTCPPWGLLGGLPGATAETVVRDSAEKPFRVPENSDYRCHAGAEIIYRTAGGGGWGLPVERDPAAVRLDVEEGYVSSEAASRFYQFEASKDVEPR